MMNIRTILVPIDFSEGAKHALNWAVDLARRFDARLRLLHVMAEYTAEWYGEAEPLPQVEALRSDLEGSARQGLQDLVPDPETTGVYTDVALEHDLNVSSAILEYASDVDANLIVMGTHGRSGIEHALLGSVAEKVVRRATRPVLTVGKSVPDDQSVDRILAPIDFSEPSKKALRAAKEMAALYGARLDLLFVAEERVVPVFRDTGLPGVSLVKMDPEIVKNSAEALSQLSEEVGGPEVELQGHVAHGDVAPRIIDFAESHDVDLIMIATRGLTGLNHFLIGSVTERVVRRAPCPVFTIHAKDEDTEAAAEAAASSEVVSE